MDLNYVREFVSLAETMSYFETASQLYITTSSLSRHIKALEAEIGAPLFSRTTRKVTLTHYGLLFLPYARQLSETCQEWNAALEKARLTEKATLTVGSIPMMKPYHITDLLAAFQTRHGDIYINIKEADSLTLIPMLRNGECDLAFVRDTGEWGSEFECLPFAHDHLCVVVPNTHPFAALPSVTPDQLKSESLLLLGKDAFMYKLCTQMCVASGFEPRIVFTSRRGENLIDLVCQGLGLALLMHKAADSLIHEPNLRLIDITPTVTTTISLLSSAKNKPGNMVRCFLDEAREWT
ncbi:MAG: LysR family transcriptional regulator [Clostridia bacterium]|nr:LysR family transcriptional regulator [Clostridia bacterium]